MVEELVPIPGAWRCPRCRFQLQKSVICVPAGGIFVDPDQRREVCPNDGVTLVQAYEGPNDRLVVMEPCCVDVDCRECYGTGERSVGWRYRDDDKVWPFSEDGDRG